MMSAVRVVPPLAPADDRRLACHVDPFAAA